MNRHISVKLLIALALAITGCASSSPATIVDVARMRELSVLQENQTGLALVPKGAYLTGLKDQSFPVNTWVEVFPAEQWPSDVPKPSLIAGKVAERSSHYARLEILALEPGIRDLRMDFSALNDVSEFKPIGKKLILPTDLSNPQSIQFPKTVSESLVGNELYGVFDLSANANQRIASSISGLAIAENDGTKSSLRLVAGEIPSNPAFVLIDAITEPAFDIDIKVFPGGNLGHDSVRSIQAVIDRAVPGSQHLSVHAQPHQTKVSSAVADLGQPQTEKLEIQIFEDETIQFIDQSLRLMNPAESVYHVVLDKDSEEDRIALAAVIHGLTMIGQTGSALWLAEQAWKSDKTIIGRAELAPSLALIYHRMERDDWALELALELKGYIGHVEDKDKTRVLASMVAVAAISGQETEFESDFQTIHQHLVDLDSPWLRLYANAVLISNDLARSAELFQSAQRALKRLGDWREDDDMRTCALKSEDDEVCANGKSQAITEFAKIWYDAETAMRQQNLSDLLELAPKIDEIGAPYLAYRIWSFLSTTHDNPENVATLWINSADYARRSQQIRTYLTMMSALQQFVSSSQPELLLKIDFTEAIRLWRILDWKSSLAALCVARAQLVPTGERLELLQYAGMLYQSLGDTDNVALVESMLSTAYEQSGQADLADQHEAVAKKFANHSQNIKVLTTVSQSNNQENP